MFTTDLIERVLAALPAARVGLLGDLFLDRYLDIDPARDEPSVETGLTAYQVVGVRNFPGALGTVMNNLSALGVGEIVPLSILGDDGEGYDLRQALARVRGVDPSLLIVSEERRTPTYTKPMYGGRELHRLDLKNRTPTPVHLQEVVLARLPELMGRVDALIVLDQVSEENCGVVTDWVREAVSGGFYPGQFVLADSRERVGDFRRVAVKPNERECGGGAAELARRVGGPVFCTRGELGIDFAPAGGGPVVRVPAYPVEGPVDVCGAGDSCSAGIVAATLAGLSGPEAAAFGNLVASITVRQIGTTGTATPAQVRARWADVVAGERAGARPATQA